MARPRGRLTTPPGSAPGVPLRLGGMGRALGFRGPMPRYPAGWRPTPFLRTTGYMLEVLGGVPTVVAIDEPVGDASD